MRKSDEIKKGLEHCSEDGCNKCPYERECTFSDGFSELAKDALLYIHQLEAERDAAVEDLKSYRACHGCKHLGVGFDEPCLHCDFENNCFEWRGVQKEE